jgi:hypothetical protein
MLSRSGSPELLDDPFSMRECTALEQRIYGSMNRALRSRKVVPLGRTVAVAAQSPVTRRRTER